MQRLEFQSLVQIEDSLSSLVKICRQNTAISVTHNYIDSIANRITFMAKVTTYVIILHTHKVTYPICATTIDSVRV